MRRRRNYDNLAIPLFGGTRIKTKRKGRICKRKGCRTKLSIYNHSSYCYIHELERKDKKWKKKAKKK